MKAASRSLSTQDENFGNRLLLIIRAIGGHKSAEQIAGVSSEMLYRYTRGDAQPTFRVAAKLAVSAGYSLDWLYSGEGPEKRSEGVPSNEGGVDTDLLETCIEALESALQETGTALPVEKKATVIKLLYQLAELDQKAGRPVESHKAQVLTLVKIAS